MNVHVRYCTHLAAVAVRQLEQCACGHRVYVAPTVLAPARSPSSARDQPTNSRAFVEKAWPAEPAAVIHVGKHLKGAAGSSVRMPLAWQARGRGLAAGAAPGQQGAGGRTCSGSNLRRAAYQQGT